MLDTDEIISHIHRLRKIGQDTQTCEVKEAVGKLPSSVPETMSAFANGEGGLFLLFGELDHCREAYESERLGRQLPPELRR